MGNFTAAAIQPQNKFFGFYLVEGIIFPILYIGTVVFWKSNKEPMNTLGLNL